METLDSIDKKISEHRDELLKLYDKRSELQFKDCNLEGKYIKYGSSEYMYVTWQTWDNLNGGKKEEKVFLQGIAFGYENLSYRDSSFVFFNAMEEFRMPLDWLKDESQVKVITEEEFKTELKNALNAMSYFTDNISDLMHKWIPKE